MSIPDAGDELATLRGFLDHFRDTLRRQTEGLDAARLHQSVPPTTMTLGGMLRHLAFVEGWWFTAILFDDPERPPFTDIDWQADWDWDWHSAAGLDPALLRAELDDAIAHADAQLERALALGEGLDLLARRERHGSRVSLRWILVHMIEEYARHAGHADLMREAIDGATDL